MEIPCIWIDGSELIGRDQLTGCLRYVRCKTCSYNNPCRFNSHLLEFDKHERVVQSFNDGKYVKALCPQSGEPRLYKLIDDVYVPNDFDESQIHDSHMFCGTEYRYWADSWTAYSIDPSADKNTSSCQLIQENWEWTDMGDESANITPVKMTTNNVTLPFGIRDHLYFRDILHLVTNDGGVYCCNAGKVVDRVQVPPKPPKRA